LILRLRFDDELSLDEISQLAGLGDAQRVHRRLTSILEKLRSAVGKGSSGKARPVSVK
jgi:DNA-directed RNA polymerase specialized sigma subunit